MTNSSSHSTPQKRGPGRPSKSQQQPYLQPSQQSQSTQPSAQTNQQTALPFQSTAAAFSSGSDFASSLPTNLHKPMQELVRGLREKRLSPQEFYIKARDLLGQNLYDTLVTSMKQNSRAKSVFNPSTSTAGSAIHSPILGLYGPMGSNFTVEERPVSAVTSVSGPSDSMALHDVMHYAGIDLKAESDLILRDQQQSIFSAAQYAGEEFLKDPKLDPSYFFNVTRLKGILAHAAKQFGLELSSDAHYALCLVLLRKLSNVLVQLVRFSRHRTDLPRRFYKIKVENDPKKQMWLLEQILTMKPQSQQQPQSPQSHQSTQQTGSQKPDTQQKKDSHDTESEEESGKKKRRTHPADDSVIKTKLTNITASVATGLKMKSWMTASNSTDDFKSQHQQKGGDGDDEKDEHPDDHEPEQSRFNLNNAPSASPLTERELIEKYLARTISVRDLIRVLEDDPKLTKSPLILHHLYQFQ